MNATYTKDLSNEIQKNPAINPKDLSNKIQKEEKNVEKDQSLRDKIIDLDKQITERLLKINKNEENLVKKPNLEAIIEENSINDSLEIDVNLNFEERNEGIKLKIDKDNKKSSYNFDEIQNIRKSLEGFIEENEKEKTWSMKIESKNWDIFDNSTNTEFELMKILKEKKTTQKSLEKFSEETDKEKTRNKEFESNFVKEKINSSNNSNELQREKQEMEIETKPAEILNNSNNFDANRRKSLGGLLEENMKKTAQTIKIQSKPLEILNISNLINKQENSKVYLDKNELSQKKFSLKNMVNQELARRQQILQNKSPEKPEYNHKNPLKESFIGISKKNEKETKMVQLSIEMSEKSESFEKKFETSERNKSCSFYDKSKTISDKNK